VACNEVDVQCLEEIFPMSGKAELILRFLRSFAAEKMKLVFQCSEGGVVFAIFVRFLG
jgi:hypothetical protein